jgi:hypothetical protein
MLQRKTSLASFAILFLFLSSFWRPDDGIALDYPSYLKANREKLHRYVALHVIGQSAKP